MDDEGPDGVSEWELVQTTGRGPGRISHHTVSVRPSKEVVFYGGLKGEDSNSEIFVFNPTTSAWLTVNPSVSKEFNTQSYLSTYLNDSPVTNFVFLERFWASTSPWWPCHEWFERWFIPRFWRFRKWFPCQRACQVFNGQQSDD